MAIIFERMPSFNPDLFPSPEIENPWQRQKSWIIALNRAKNEVVETTMLIRPGLETNMAIHELARIAHSVPTKLYIDAINYLQPNNAKNSLFPQNFFSVNNMNWQPHFEAGCREIRNSGIELFITNPPRNFIPYMFPWIGRDHRKIGVVDNKVAWLKDYNYGDESFDMLCYAIKFQDPATIAALRKQVEYSRFIDKDGNFIDNRPSGDLVVDIPGQPYQLLMDRGDKGKSIMLDYALYLAKRPGLAIHANQYPISGRMAKSILERAKNEQFTIVITSNENDPKNLSKFSGRKLAAEKWEKNTQDNPYITTIYHSGKVHSKAFLLWTPAGVIGIVGTNNFNEAGIYAGTAENGIYLYRGSDLGNQFFYRHLEDVRIQSGEQHPLAHTPYEQIIEKLTA